MLFDARVIGRAAIRALEMGQIHRGVPFFGREYSMRRAWQGAARLVTWPGWTLGERGGLALSPGAYAMSRLNRPCGARETAAFPRWASTLDSVHTQKEQAGFYGG
jgi:hypothetical protein